MSETVVTHWQCLDCHRRLARPRARDGGCAECGRAHKTTATRNSAPNAAIRDDRSHRDRASQHMAKEPLGP